MIFYTRRERYQSVIEVTLVKARRSCGLFRHVWKWWLVIFTDILCKAMW